MYNITNEIPTFVKSFLHFCLYILQFYHIKYGRRGYLYPT